MEMEINPNATTVTTAPPTTTHRQYWLRARNGAYGGRGPVSAGFVIAVETTWVTEPESGEGGEAVSPPDEPVQADVFVTTGAFVFYGNEGTDQNLHECPDRPRTRREPIAQTELEATASRGSTDPAQEQPPFP
jgi:hypothetical protein